MQHIQADCIILGAGVSGMVCAARAVLRGKRVLVLDHAHKPLRKLLVTGGGKCNITNTHIETADYIGENPQFARSALTRFTPTMMREMLHSANITLEEREHGQIFCRRTAEDVRNLLLANAAQAQLCLSVRLVRVEKQAHLFHVHTQTFIATAPTLVVATGSPAWPQTGATDAGFVLAKQFGHALVAPRPALAGFVLPPHSPLRGLAGIALPVTLHHTPARNTAASAANGTAVAQGTAQQAAATPENSAGRKRVAGSAKNTKAKPVVVAHNLPLLFTHTGLSGPAALQASLYWRKGDVLVCNFLPQHDIPALLADQTAGKLLVKNRLRGLGPARLFEALVPPALLQKKLAEVSKQEQATLAALLSAFPLEVATTQGFAKAEVCVGGVSTHHVSSQTMQSKCVDGLFFCGEVLDITGRLGGYNLHWAFASGLAAGEGV